MLDPQRTTLAKIKEAYGLNARELQSLLDALAPKGIFPLELWRTAYTSFWKNPVRENARLYKLYVPTFPEADSIPEKFCPTNSYAHWMVDLFISLTKILSYWELQKGFDFIFEATYDGQDNEFIASKENLYSLLALDEKNIANAARIEGYKKTQVHKRDLEFIFKLFPETIILDKAAAIRYLHICGYPLQHEVKGLSRALVMQLTSTPEPDNTLETAAILIPSVMWEGRTYGAVRDAMRESNYSDPVIAYVLHHWCGLKNKTQIGKLLGPIGGQDDSASLRQAKRLLAEAHTLSISKA